MNLNAIAKEANFHEILKLCNFVIYTAVVCADNEKYIQKIQQLSPQSQQQLMLLIDNVGLLNQKRARILIMLDIVYAIYTR